MTRNIEVQVRSAVQPRGGEPVEMCEHKGVGHPDTLTDGVCEAASRALSREYLRQCGRVLHHNLDKGLLIGGQSRPRFGGGDVLKPMRFVICGRATPLTGGGEVAELVGAAARAHLLARAGLQVGPAQVITEIAPTSDNLQRVFSPGHAVARANDTSFGVGYAPHSALEECVLSLAQELQSPSFRAAFPAAGLDFKVMGLRRDGEVTLTVAVALIDRYIDSVARYFEVKDAMHDKLGSRLPRQSRLRLNALDDPAATDESGVYLTVTGLSGEMGDDGQVGRGNRVNGLITPGRPMSLEAAAGKNPVSHVGKLYNVMALLIARDIRRELGTPSDVTVQLLSAIGDRVDEPQIASIDIACGGAADPAAPAIAQRVAAQWLSEGARVTEMILDERIALY